MDTKMTKQELKLATEMLTAVMDVLEANNIPSKYYVEHFGQIMDAEAISILEQEQENV
jgi:hypothetical protein